MALHIEDLIPPDDLRHALDEEFVRIQTHPTAPLTIYNYTEKAQYARFWNAATRQCRGLIVDHDGQVVARPFGKFHNLAEHTDAEIAAVADEPVEVWEKEDGSLGIIYPSPDGSWAVATRGSFASEQAQWATRLIRGEHIIPGDEDEDGEWYPDAPDTRFEGWAPPDGVTVLCEIVYPQNRIVVDYAGYAGLILLGGIVTETGEWMPPEFIPWPDRVVERHPHASLEAVLDSPERLDREGYVLRFTRSGFRVKVKHQEYVRLHRIVTGCTAKLVWSYMAVASLYASGLDAKTIGTRLKFDRDEAARIIASVQAAGGKWEQAFLQSVPEEFERWFQSQVRRFARERAEWEHDKRVKLFAATAGVDTTDRKAVAAAIRKWFPAKEDMDALFSLSNFGTVLPESWRAVKPGHEPAFKTMTEDVA